MKKIHLFVCLTIIWGLLTACGKQQAPENEELNSYRDDMTACYESIASSASALDTIDPASDTAVSDMLSQLDQINTAFQNMAALEVPKEYSSVETIADDAAYYMSEASRLYREAYSGEVYQADIGASAKAHYTTAMKYLSYIGDILKGEIPEGDEITVTYIQ